MGANNRINFNDGEGLTHEDLDAIVSHLLKHEDDRYFRKGCAAAFYDPSDIEGQYGAGGESGPFIEGTTLTALTNTSNRTVTLEAGPVWTHTQDADPDTEADDVRGMMRFEYPGSGHTLAAAAGGDRWDKISYPLPAETEGSSESRDFKDAVTGALSSQSVAKRRSLDSTPMVVTQGTLGGAIPATPANSRAVCAVKVRDGAAGIALVGAQRYTDLVDYTYPLGRHRVCRFGIDAVHDGNWATLGTTKLSSTGAGVAYYFPGDFKGDPEARLLGVVIEHKINEAATIDLVRFPFDNGAVTVLKNIALSAADGTYRYIQVSGDSNEIATGLPLWCNGTSGGRMVERHNGHWQSGDEGSSVALRFTAIGSLTDIVAVTWIVGHE